MTSKPSSSSGSVLGVTHDQLRPLLEAGVGDVPAPHLDLPRLPLQGDDPPAEDACGPVGQIAE